MNFTILLFNLKLVDIISKHGCVLETGKKNSISTSDFGCNFWSLCRSSRGLLSSVKPIIRDGMETNSSKCCCHLAKHHSEIQTQDSLFKFHAQTELDG